jgi:hypothetical protein
MKKLQTAAIVMLTFFLSSSAFGQFKLSLEPAFGMNFNLHSGSDIESGSGVGIVFSGHANMSFSKSIGLIAGIAFYDNRTGSYTETGTDQTYGKFSTEINASLAYFQLESLFKYELPSGLYFVVGPVLGFNVESEAQYKIHLQQFNQTVDGKSTIKETQVRFELKTGAGYLIPISKDIFITPQVTFGYGLTNVVKDFKWKVLTFQAVCGVSFVII